MLNNKWIPLACLIAMLAFAAYAYPQLPDQIPTHWNAQGEPDDWNDRLLGVLLMPGVTLGVWGMLLIGRAIDPKRASYAQFPETFQFVINLMAIFTLAMHVVTLSVALGWALPVERIIPAAVALMIAALGNVLTRVRPNWFIGIRTPWTLADPEVWRRTHRVGSRAVVTAGLAAVVAALLLPQDWVPPAFMALLLLGFGFAYGYSYWIWRRLNTGRESSS